jgi:hypothetical protein
MAKTTILSVPYGRGKSKISRPWAKTVTAVGKNANSGHDYSGDWLVQGADVEAEPGDIIAVQDGDGDGAAIYVMVPDHVTGDAQGMPTRTPTWVEIESDGGKSWAAKCCVTTRRFLAMTPAERVAAGHDIRRAEITARLEEIKRTPTYASRFSPENSLNSRDAAWWLAYSERLLAEYDTAPVSPLAHISTADLLAELVLRGIAS